MNPNSIAVAIGVCVLLLVLGLVLLSGRGAMMIAGYNTMSKARRAKIDEKALGRFVGWLLIAMIPLQLLVLAGEILAIAWLVTGGIALTIALLVAGLIYANTGKRFQKEE